VHRVKGGDEESAALRVGWGRVQGCHLRCCCSVAGASARATGLINGNMPDRWNRQRTIGQSNRRYTNSLVSFRLIGLSGIGKGLRYRNSKS